MNAAACCAVAVAVGAIVATYETVGLTFDERVHVEAGLEWLENETYLYTVSPENPPLARVAVALGPYLAGHRIHDAAGSLRGAQLDSIDSDDPTFLILARLGVLPFFVGACFLLYAIARRLFDRPTSLVALIAFISTPPVLAHSGLATTDVPLVCAFLGAVLALLHWLRRPSVGSASLLGVTFGLALLTKFSALIFLPCACVIALLGIDDSSADATISKRPKRWPGLLVAALLVLPATLWSGYRFRVGSTVHSNWDPGRVRYAFENCPLTRDGGAQVERLANASIPAPELVVGVLDLCAHQSGGHRSYLLGHISTFASHAYYPVALLAKTPLPLLAFGFAGAWLGWRSRGRERRRLVPLVCAAIILLAAMTRSINVGLRHVLAIYPFLCMLAAHAGVEAWRWGPRLARLVFCVAAALQLTAAVQSHRLAFFNFAFSRHPENVLLDSDLDWGQDLPGLQRVLRTRKIDQLHIAYFGTSNLCRHSLPPLTWLAPNRPTSGWIAISEMYRKGIIQGYFPDHQICERGQYVSQPTDPNGYAWLDSYVPVEIIGGSIRLYYIPAAQR